MSDISHLFPNFVSGGRSTRCPKGHAIPDHAVSCPECLLEPAEKALQKLQVEFLLKARQGEWNYTLRVAKGPQRHALLYPKGARTFCGREVKTKEIEHLPYANDTLAKLCPACRAAITSTLDILDGQP